MTREEQIAALRAKLAARENRPGFKNNVEEIKRQIERLEAEGDDDGA
jgi:hypothetical protein